MGDFAPSQWLLCHAGLRKMLFFFGMAVSTLIAVQFWGLPYEKWIPPRSGSEDPLVILFTNASLPNSSAVDVVANHAYGSDPEEEDEAGNGRENGILEFDFSADFVTNGSQSPHKSKRSMVSETSNENLETEKRLESDNSRETSSSAAASVISHQTLARTMETLESNPGTSGLLLNGNSISVVSLVTGSKYGLELEHKNPEPLQTAVISQNTTSAVNRPKRRKIELISVAQMNLLLVRSAISPHSLKPRWSSVRDRELLAAKLKIENAPILRTNLELQSSIYRNISKFKRSYELMEQTLKVYIYKEGVKPLFHQPKTRGIYASEGWFMKLMHANKKFVVRNPGKAHLFYLPFSTLMLREAVGQNFSSHMDIQRYLKEYIKLVARKYKFWNRTDGADHFLVACHDWAPKFTEHMEHCLRSLCNANAGKDFRIGKDTSLPVTYIRSAATPVEYLGGRPPSERPILAFFAGGMHGYLRPILIQHWENKEADMKIFGPMSRDIEGKRKYREYMKSSRYCICARGYEVHTPRVVEAIFHECVPVIISDNYVPPFFEMLNWEEFAVFVLEKDVPDLRNILASIPEKRYLEMQARLKMVRQHFLWHRYPVKYDLFHMILHSVWYNRVFNMRTK